jgi:hypothetical protein
VGNPVLTWLLGGRTAATALLEEDPVQVAEVHARLIDQIGLAKAGQRLGIRINLDRAPTHDELADAARRSHLSVILLDVAEESA